MTEILHRFVYRNREFLPGGITIGEKRLQGEALLIHCGRNPSIEEVHALAKHHPQAVLDIQGADEGDVIDSIMLGMRRVTVDGWVDIAKVKMAHAVSPSVITRFQLNGNPDALFDRLWSIREEVQPVIMFIGKSSGDIREFLAIYGEKLAIHYAWFLAPVDGRIDSDINSSGLLGWCISPDKLLTAGRS